MRWPLISVFLLALVAPVLAEEYLPSRGLDLPIAIVPYVEPGSFDLMDFREQQRAPAKSRVDTDPHSIFVVKQHVGLAGGWDGGVAHGSVGFYLTVAEWGRWNFGVPSMEIGIGRYPVYNSFTRQSFMKDELTFLVSVASVHYRAGYLRSWGVNCYINLEQVFDLHSNQAGSQFGLSFSRK
ncbi:MAG: hypothetical protein DMF92_09765 [Acidobacteria bacterium]|nr:MAG: hypothetical protein DMF92_09765 [Acidobacteriota bacterium]